MLVCILCCMVIRSDYYDDVYFSAQDGLDETRYVFLDGNNLQSRWQSGEFNGDEFVIAETGFGTGLNFLASWHLFRRVAASDKKLHFISVEKHPLEKAKIAEALSVWHDQIGDEMDAYLAAYPDDITQDFDVFFDDKRVHLTVLMGDAVCRYKEQNFQADAWFLMVLSPRLIRICGLRIFLPKRLGLQMNMAVFQALQRLVLFVVALLKLDLMCGKNRVLVVSVK